MNFDVVIVGGGINGVGVARDCALRGISCLLVEKNDFSSGTSWASSGMIHGGARYLLHDTHVTQMACIDSGYIQKMAPHLLFRIPFIYPVYKTAGQSALAAQFHLESVEAFFEVYDRFVAFKNGQVHQRLSADETIALEPNLPRANLLGAITFDEWGIDVPRLCLANIIDAVEHGAVALNHTEVIAVTKKQHVVTGVTLRDVLTGEEKNVSCQVLVNTTGPWAPHFAKLVGVPIELRGGKGVHLVFDRRLCNMAITSQAIDGREIFIMPHENTTMIATTDDDYFGDLDNQRTTEDEIKYLLEGITPIFPAVRDARLISSMSGVRPTLYKRNVSEDDLSREHEVLDHEARDGLKGVISLIGGKLASYRVMAEETTNLIAQKLNIKTPCTTHSKTLPGGDETPNVSELAQEFNVPEFVVSRLVYRHGSRAKNILELMQKNDSCRAIVCACEPVTQAEIQYALQHEMVRTLSDLRRRTRVTQGPCQGTDCLISAAASLCLQQEENELLLSDFHRNVWRFLNEWWWNRGVVLDGVQFKQEELFQALHFTNNGLDLL